MIKPWGVIPVFGITTQLPKAKINLLVSPGWSMFSLGPKVHLSFHFQVPKAESETWNDRHLAKEFQLEPGLQDPAISTAFCGEEAK